MQKIYICVKIIDENLITPEKKVESVLIKFKPKIFFIAKNFH
jgi:hypothetical protein